MADKPQAAFAIPTDQQSIPNDPDEWMHGFAASLEETRRAQLDDRQKILAAKAARIQQAREAMAQDGASPATLARLDRAVASTTRRADVVASTREAASQVSAIDPAGYALSGRLANAAGEGPANGSASLVVTVNAKPVKVATSRIGPDGALHLVLSAAAAKEYAGQSAAVQITIAGKTYPFDAKVTIKPGRAEIVRLPLLTDEPLGRGKAAPTSSETPAAKPDDTVKPKVRTAARTTVKKDEPK